MTPKRADPGNPAAGGDPEQTKRRSLWKDHEKDRGLWCKAGGFQ